MWGVSGSHGWTGESLETIVSQCHQFSTTLGHCNYILLIVSHAHPDSVRVANAVPLSCSNRRSEG